MVSFLPVVALVLLLLGPLLYVVQLWRKLLIEPWYAPAFATVSALLLLVAAVFTPDDWIIVGLLVCVLVAGLEWYFLLRFTRLPRYVGPAAVGRPFPAFTTTRADGRTPFTQEDLKGDRNTVLVFFRGRW
jgi:steroid 5-alpha reductase family enzyme